MKNLIEQYVNKNALFFNLEIELLSPTAIRSGNNLSPLVDYHIKDNSVYYLNSDHLLNDISEKGYLSDFEAKVIEYSGNSSAGTEINAKQKNNFIAKFLKEHNETISSFLEDCPKVKCQIKGDASWVRLQQVTRQNGGAYIPASSIKGAIRTAIIYAWLTAHDEGEEYLKTYVKRNKEIFKSKINEKEKLGDKLYKAKKKENESKEEIKFNQTKLKEIEIENKNSVIKSLQGFEEEVVRQVFGESGGQYNMASFLRISDTSVFPDHDLVVTSLTKKYRENAQTKKKRTKEFSPSFQELISIGSKGQFSINIPNLRLDRLIINKLTAFNKIKESLFSSSHNLKSLFHYIRTFNEEYLDFELERLNGFEENDNTSYKKCNLSGFHAQLKKLKTEFENLKSNETIMALGFGKSIFVNTLMLALTNSDRDFFRDIVKLLHPHHPANKYFPISYYTVSIDSKDYPLGWIKITDPNTEAYKEEIQISDYDINKLQKGDQIQGLLIKKGGVSKVKISINKEIKTVNASGISKFERLHQKKLEIGQLYDFEINVIKDAVIREIKK